MGEGDVETVFDKVWGHATTCITRSSVREKAEEEKGRKGERDEPVSATSIKTCVTPPPLVVVVVFAETTTTTLPSSAYFCPFPTRLLKILFNAPTSTSAFVPLGKSYCNTKSSFPDAPAAV